MIVPLQPWHLMSVILNLRDSDVDELIALGVTEPQRWACQRALAPGVAFTALDTEGIPVACFGLVEERGIGTAWLMATPRGYLYRKSMIKAFRKIVAAEAFRVIEAGCLEAREGARFLLEHLGFSYRGMLPKRYPSGHGMMFYSIVR